MRLTTLVLAGLITFAASNSDALAKGRHHHRRHACKCAASCQDTGYRIAAWGSRYYHTSAECKDLPKVGPEKLVEGAAATYGRKAHHCCCANCK